VLLPGHKQEKHLTRWDFLLLLAEIMLKEVTCAKGKFKKEAAKH